MKLYIEETELVLIKQCLLADNYSFIFPNDYFKDNLGNKKVMKLIQYLYELNQKYDFSFLFAFEDPSKNKVTVSNAKPTSFVNYEYISELSSTSKEQLERDKLRAQKIIDQISENQSQSKPYVLNIPYTIEDERILGRYLKVTLSESKSTKLKIKRILDEYLVDFENGELSLPDLNFISPKHHFNKFIAVIKVLEHYYDNKNLALTRLEEILFETYPELKKHPLQYRFLEYFLLMEKKGYIKFKTIGFQTKKYYPWKITFDLLRSVDEIKSLHGNWISFGNLSLRPQTGHAFNGKYHFVFQKEKAPMKALQLFIENPEKPFSVEYLESHCFGDKSATPKQATNRINNLIDKSIRKQLGMNKPDSKVNIIGTEGSFILSAIPDRGFQNLVENLPKKRKIQRKQTKPTTK